MNALPSPSQYASGVNQLLSESTMKALVSSVWHVIEQPPPPSLREILGAYKAKGDGDRDMLMAMLNAKSAEDQRLASFASLHRTLLEAYQVPPLTQDQHHHHITSSHHYNHRFPSPSTSYHQPHPYSPIPGERSPRPHFRDEHITPAALQSKETAIHHPRKRRRISRSPPPSHPPLYEYRERSDSEVPSHQLPLPPSPYSSSSSIHSSGGSPRSRDSMAIGALLSSQTAMKDERPSKRRSSAEGSSGYSEDRREITHKGTPHRS